MINISIKEEFVGFDFKTQYSILSELSGYIACSAGMDSLAALMKDGKRFEVSANPSTTDKYIINIFKDGVHIIQISDDFHPIELE